MTQENAEKIEEVDAKGGRRVKGMPVVLAISTVAAAVLLLGVLVIYVF